MIRLTIKQNLDGRSLDDIVRAQEVNLSLSSRPGVHYKEPFDGGFLSGIRMQALCNEGGRLVTGVYYFLQDGDTVWTLRFTGRAGSPGLARNITDGVARFLPHAEYRHSIGRRYRPFSKRRLVDEDCRREI
jgi:hypothetical protein